jgi:hypothetical protein
MVKCMTSSGSTTSPTTNAFFAQAVISFGVAIVAVAAGLAYLPVNGWVRGFLALGLLYTVTSAFTLAKCIRDRQEDTYLVSRVDQARLDKLLAEHGRVSSCAGDRSQGPRLHPNQAGALTASGGSVSES